PPFLESPAQLAITENSWKQSSSEFPGSRLAAGRPEVQSIEVDHGFPAETLETDFATGKDDSPGNFGRGFVDGNDEGRVGLCFLEGTIGGRKGEDYFFGFSFDNAEQVHHAIVVLPKARRCFSFEGVYVAVFKLWLAGVVDEVHGFRGAKGCRGCGRV